MLETDLLLQFLQQQGDKDKGQDLASLFQQVVDAVKGIKLEERPIKGRSVMVFDSWQANGLSDKNVDCRGFNRVNFQVFVTGTTPSATISIEGGTEGGGNYLPVSDPDGSQDNVTTSRSLDCIVGTHYAKVRIANISGTFAYGQGFTVIVTPYIG